VVLGSLFAPGPQAQALAFLALLAVDEERWGEAQSLVDRALALVDEHSLEERPALAHAFATAALLTARTGATGRARELAKHAAWLLTVLKSVAQWMLVETQIVLARTSLALGDPAEATMWITDAETALARYPDSGTLPARAGEVRARISSAELPLGLIASPLTTAELRVLRFLPTHLSFAQIADELFVSRNTVKTQAIAVYRKLDVSSRGQAVERARALGLLGL
jgi:LuxR family maltose regulon positive regulatory protein